MHRIALDGSGWHTAEDFFGELLVALGAPSWLGHTVDAVADSIAGDQNLVGPPFEIVITGRISMGLLTYRIVSRFCDRLDELRAQGHSVRATCVD